MCLVVAVGCGGDDESDTTQTSPASAPTTTATATEPEPDNPAVAMTAMPPGAARVCARFDVLAPSCPASVPESRFGLAGPPIGQNVPYADGGYARCLERGAGDCTAAVFHLEGGVPSDDPRRDRPPRFLHYALYAAEGKLDRHFPFELPCTGPVVRDEADRILVAPRETAACLGEAELAGQEGTLALAPPFPAGGEAGGHLLFFWRDGGVTRAATLHAWAPVAETVDALERVTASAGNLG